MYRNQVSGEYT